SIAAPAGSSLLVIGGIDLWSADLARGVNWTNLTNAYGSGTVHADEHAIVAVDANHWYIGNDGGIWSTANAGTTWSNLNATLGMIQFYSVTPDPTTAGRLLGGSQDNGTALGSGLSAQQRSWNLVWGGDGGHTAINPANPQQLFTENFNVSLRRSDDGGANFSTTVVDTKTITDPSEFYVPFGLGPQDPGTAYLATTRVWRGPATASGGVGWAAISPDLTHPNLNSQEQDDLTAIAVAPSSADVIYAGAFDGSISVTTDASAATPTWTQLSGAGGPVSAIAVSPTDPNTVYWGMGFIGQIASIFKTSAGKTVDISGNLPGTPINAIVIDPANPSDIFIATDVGVFAAGDGGT
ncbi:MAG: WD40/YVTN/BNR-like repeat-containing protein, partial [Terriglobales bacterium]